MSSAATFLLILFAIEAARLDGAHALAIYQKLVNRVLL